MPKLINTTLNDLAGMVAKGFEAVNKRFDDVERKMATKNELNEVKDELNEVRQKVLRIDYRVEELHDIIVNREEGEILNLQKRVKILEGTVKTLVK